MLIDYVPLMLTNMAAAFFTLAAFVRRQDRGDDKHWSPVFLIIGLVATICGFAMTFTWPLPTPYSATFGETSIMLGVLFLGASVALAKEYRLHLLGYYAIIVGIVAILLGARIINLELTRTPLLSGIGFIFSGLSGVLAGPFLLLRTHRSWRYTAMIVLLIPALIWLRIALLAYWEHLES